LIGGEEILEHTPGSPAPAPETPVPLPTAAGMAVAALMAGASVRRRRSV
jgi:uncharacterized protein (TIGR03382 family)